MKKVTLFLLASTCISNSFAMLTTTSKKVAAHKKIKTLHAPQRSFSIFDIWAYESASDASIQSRANQELLKENNALLKKIAEQNEETHKLLRATFLHDYLLAHERYNNWAARDNETYSQLINFYDMLAKEHNIKIKHKCDNRS
jgi:hypothetical protein